MFFSAAHWALFALPTIVLGAHNFWPEAEPVGDSGKPLGARFLPSIARYAEFNRRSAAMVTGEICSGAVPWEVLNKNGTLLSRNTDFPELQLFAWFDPKEKELVISFPDWHSTYQPNQPLEERIRRYGMVSYSPGAGMFPWSDLLGGAGMCDKQHKCLVAEGLLKTWKSITDLDWTYLIRRPERFKRITITGHGMGGGLAEIAFGEMLQSMRLSGSQSFSDDISLFTYGQPRIGNQAYADFIDHLANTSYPEPGKYSRVTYIGDNISKYPATGLWGDVSYRHAGNEFVEGLGEWSDETGAINGVLKCDWDHNNEWCEISDVSSYPELAVYPDTTEWMDKREHQSFAGFENAGCGSG